MMLVIDGPVTGESNRIKSNNVAHDSYKTIWMGTMKTCGFGFCGTTCNSILYLPVNRPF